MPYQHCIPHFKNICTAVFAFLITFLGAAAQLPGRNILQVKGTICIDAEDRAGAVIRVMAEQVPALVFPAGKEVQINMLVPELPVRLAIVVMDVKSPPVLLGHFWVETSDPFTITGNGIKPDNIIFLPHSELNAFEAELARTPKPDMQLRLIAANSYHEAGLYHLWQQRHQYKSGDLEYMLRRANITAKAFSSFRLLHTFFEALTNRGFLAAGPLDSITLPAYKRQSVSIPSHEHELTLVYIPVPGSADTRAPLEELKLLANAYAGRLQVVTILYPSLKAPMVVQGTDIRPEKILRQMHPLYAFDSAATWPQVFDYSGESLLHFRVKLLSPLSHGFEYGLEAPGRNPLFEQASMAGRRTAVSRGINMPMFQQNDITMESSPYLGGRTWDPYSLPAMSGSLLKSNRPVFLLLSREGMIVKRWTGYYKEGALLAGIKKADTSEAKARLRTRPS